MIDVAIAVSRPRQPGSIFTQIGWSLAGLLVLLLAAAAAEPLLIQRAEKNMIEIGGADLGLAQGWSAKEFSDTLPGPNGPISAVYRWSGPSSSLVFARTGQRFEKGLAGHAHQNWQVKNLGQLRQAFQHGERGLRVGA